MFRHYLELSIEYNRKRLEHFKRILTSRPSKMKLNSRMSRQRNKLLYYVRQPGKKEHYVRKEEFDLVLKLQEQEFARRMVERISHNLRIQEKLIGYLLPDSEQEVLEEMPRTYRPIRASNTMRQVPQSENPKHREQLKIRTSFGLMVRSRAEAMIAEQLYSLGVEFYYEKALPLYSEKRGCTVTYYPDFTIVLPADQEFYWEHEGLLHSKEYAELAVLKHADYKSNGIYESHNLIVTGEGPGNEIDVEGIQRIISGCLLPLIRLE